MLILSRKVGEEIMIGGGITVVVNRISGDRVTLAFKAPADVRILRGELTPKESEIHPGNHAAPAGSPEVTMTIVPQVTNRVAGRLASLPSRRTSRPR